MVGKDYLNNKILPARCRKSGVPQSDSHGPLTSHRARATIATQLLNAREPLTLADLQQWLGHKHPASTRHYAAILQRTLTAAHKKARLLRPQRPLPPPHHSSRSLRRGLSNEWCNCGS
ncbi:tyrosine-type recombinase/integrase [Streptomyces acidicola]|uniref:tyrosine-type recombinase/integrase n=1 Tax=Streptomyces acidicola TaxID=2596892 RepID=UPI003820CFE9